MLVYVADLRLVLIERCAEIDGAAPGEGAFSPGPAIWVGRREVSHLDGRDSPGVRLSEPIIAKRRGELRTRSSVELRRGASYWVRVRLRSEGDFENEYELVRDAVEANAPTAEPGHPPSGAALARRRRFH